MGQMNLYSRAALQLWQDIDKQKLQLKIRYETPDVTNLMCELNKYLHWLSIVPEAAPQNIIVSYKLTGLFLSKQKSAYFMGVKVFYLDYRFADEDVMDEKDNDKSFSLLPHWPLR